MIRCSAAMLPVLHLLRESFETPPNPGQFVEPERPPPVERWWREDLRMDR